MAWREIPFMESNGEHNAEGVSPCLFFNQAGLGRGYVRVGRQGGANEGQDNPFKFQVVAWKWAFYKRTDQGPNSIGKKSL